MTSNAGTAAHQAKHSDALGVGIVVGLGAYGLVHLLIAWLALQVAWTDQKTKTDPSGAVHTLADQPLGSALLIAGGVGLVALVIWQGLEAAVGHRREDGMKRVQRRLGSAGKVVVYAILAFMMFKTVAGSSAGGAQSDSLTAQLMKAPLGQLLVGAVGVGVICVGGYLAIKGVTRRFADDDLDPKSGEPTERLGQVGHVAKGISLAIVGGLFVWAAASHEPKKSGGLDQALQLLLEQPFGAWLLTAVAIGIACFGFYCFAWARHRRT